MGPVLQMPRSPDKELERLLKADELQKARMQGFALGGLVMLVLCIFCLFLSGCGTHEHPTYSDCVFRGQDCPAGPTGATGTMGSTGAVGETGIQGQVGATGATGSQGDAGPTGVGGNNGEPGIAGQPGVTGATGPMGEQGIPGMVGAAGTVGPEGPIGATGPQGIPGLVGATGPTGADGEPGTIVSTIQFCPDDTSAFPEYGIIIGGAVYAVYWGSTPASGGASQAFLARIVPGSYESTGGNGCHFTLNNDNTVTE